MYIIGKSKFAFHVLTGATMISLQSLLCSNVQDVAIILK